MSLPARMVVCLLILGFSPVLGKLRADFQIHDGDTVVFLGDSITAERTYGKVVENYTLLRFPERKVRFINAGRGGDTAAGGLKRLDREVLDQGATVVIVAYGINDIGWGTQANDEHRQRYLDSIRGIVERCRSRHVRVFIASAAITNESNDHGDTDYLQRMCDDGMSIARDLGAGAIDIQRSMRTIHRQVRAAAAQTAKEQDRPSLHKPDGIHLSELGSVAMAFAVLKGLDAPAEVSAATLDARNLGSFAATGCQVSQIKGGGDRLEFDRRDDGLPLNLGVLGLLRFRFIPFGEQLNQYTLTVKNLPAGRFDVRVDDRGLGHWSSEELGKGINIASATANGWEPGGPWEAAAWVLRQLTDSRSEIAEARRNLEDYLPNLPSLDQNRAGIEATLRSIEADQRRLVQPRPFHFIIEPHVEKPKKD